MIAATFRIAFAMADLPSLSSTEVRRAANPNGELRADLLCLNWVRAIYTLLMTIVAGMPSYPGR